VSGKKSLLPLAYKWLWGSLSLKSESSLSETSPRREATRFVWLLLRGFVSFINAWFTEQFYAVPGNNKYIWVLWLNGHQTIVWNTILVFLFPLSLLQTTPDLGTPGVV
jgi:hypothetical protein